MTPDRQHPDDSEYLHAKPDSDSDERDLVDGGELSDDAEPMAPPTPFDLSMPSSAADDSETTTSGRSRRASVRRSSQSHRLMRTVLERLRDYDIDEVRVLRNKALASSKAGESTRRAAAAQKPVDPPKPADSST